MFRRLSEDIAFLLIKNKILDIENRDIYIYSIEVILLNVSILITNIVLSILTNGLIHFIGFVLFFVPLRILVGGYHCDHSESCFVLSVSVYALTLLLVKYDINICTNIILLILALVSIILILIWSPLINKNHPLEDYQISRNKKIVYGIIIIDFVLFIIFSKYNISLVSSEVIFIISVGITLVMGRIKEKINKLKG